MKRSSIIATRLACALLLTAFVGCTGSTQHANDIDTRVSSVEHLTGQGLRVRTDNGSVDVRHRKRPDVQITANLRAVDQTRLDETMIVTKRDANGTLEVYAKWPGGKSMKNESCSFDILIPNATRTELTSSNGKLSITAIGTDTVLTTSNGEIEATDLHGPVKANTSNGAINLTNVNGQIDAKTSNGEIHARQVTAPFNLSTSNGKITIELAPEFSSVVDIRTSNSSISTSGLKNARLISSGEDWMRLGFGELKAESNAHTSNGKIILKSANQ